MRKPELPALTGIRFYAAVFVFLSHVIIIPGMENLSAGHLLFSAGVVGVSFFFVLSGFILTYNYADVFRDGVSLANYKQFVWDRWTKIYPVQLVTLLMVLPISISSPNLPLDWRAVPAHLFLLQCWWPFTEPAFNRFLNVPSWSISCEWFFYLLAPLAMFCALGRRRRWVPVLLTSGYICALGLILSHSHSDYSRLYFVSWFAPSRFIEFLIGIFVARTFMTTAGTKSTTLALLAQTAGFGLIVAGAMYRAQAPWPLWGGLLYAPGSALLVFGLAQGRGFFAIHLSHRWLERLGMASFSFYMAHAVVLRAMKGVWLHLGWEVRSWAAFAGVAVGMFLIVQTVAFILYYFYELPVQKRLRSWMRTTPPTPSPTLAPRRAAA
jgi:peptidoglycan/LPS O-acetylase OafA/YrhL